MEILAFSQCLWDSPEQRGRSLHGGPKLNWWHCFFRVLFKVTDGIHRISPSDDAMLYPPHATAFFPVDVFYLWQLWSVSSVLCMCRPQTHHKLFSCPGFPWIFLWSKIITGNSMIWTTILSDTKSTFDHDFQFDSSIPYYFFIFFSSLLGAS